MKDFIHCYSLRGFGAMVGELASSKGWQNYLLVVNSEASGPRVYRLGWHTGEQRWAKGKEISALFADELDRGKDLLDALLTATKHRVIADIPSDSELYRDESLEALAREVTGGSLPQVTAVDRVCVDRNEKQNLDRRIARRLPYRSEVGLLARVQSANKPEGWIGRPPRWWLTLTPLDNEQETQPAGDPTPAKAPVPVEKPTPTIDGPLPSVVTEWLAEWFFKYILSGAQPVDFMPKRLDREGGLGDYGVTTEALIAALPIHTSRGIIDRVKASDGERRIGLYLPEQADIPW